MKTLTLKKVGENNYQIEILPWMFGWYSRRVPTFEYLKQRLSGHFIPDQLMQKVLEILGQMAQKGYQTGRLVADVKCEYLTSDVKYVGDNLRLTHPNYSYQKPEFEYLVGCISECTETFNAGNGRVTAGRYDNEYYKIIEIGEPIWVTNP